MAINLKFDLTGNPEPPSIVLANRNGNKLGQLNVNVDSIDVSDKFNAASEFSFTLNKYIDGELTPLWDKVKDFKLVYCPEWDLWFEIKVELDETTETVKTVFCTQLGQAELSQIMVYNIHINEEGDPNWDTNNETYKSTILYDPQNTDVSLLHRLLKDKAPHYSIAYVDESIQRIQKTFSFDGTSICDAFNEIAEEIGCLFIYNFNSTKGGKPNRTISVYDLQQNCKDCGHRGEFTDKCPKCESTNIKYGYGEDTAIFVTSDELATEGIQLVTDVDAVKNCFKLEGGDNLMTATIRNCNPNGSDYIWYFSDNLKEDMSDELVEKLESYDEKYKEYYNNHTSILNSNLVAKYNALVEKYDDYYNTKSTCLNCNNEDYFYEQCPNCNSKNILVGQKLQTIDTEITGYSDLMTAYYNTIDLLLYLKSSLMPTPDIEANKTSAEEQIALLTTSSLSPVAVNVKEAENISEATSKNAVLSMAKVLIKSTYKVEAETLAFNNVIDTDGVIVAKTWEGKFTVTNYSDDTDTATSDSISVMVNIDAKTFIEQKIEKALNKENTDDYSITGLFAKEYDEFCEEIKKYALNLLDSFSKACDTCLSILAEQGVGDDGSNEDNETDETTKKALYDALYKPYFDKQQAINTEIKTRQNEITIIEGVWDKSDESNPKCTTWGLQQYIEKCQQDIQEALDFEKHLGEDLWLEFCAYRREDKYTNSNYVSDGLNNAELFDRALEFIRVAEEEIFKSAELQHSISATLNNLLSLPKFKPLLKSFKTGNWIRVQVDDKVYKLRLLEYGFGYGDSESISVEFSDVTKIKNGVTDVKEVLEQASSMASSYDSVQRQAEKGNVARSTIDQWLVDGLNAANMQIVSNDSEEVLLTKSGLLARSYDDITGTYSPEQFKLTHNIMAYTDDNWKTVKQSIGKHKYSAYDEELGEIVDNKIGYGMSAEFVTAGVVSGSQIIGGDIYSDNYSITGRTGSYLNLRDGTFSFGGGALRFEGGELLISSPNVVTKNEVTTINEEYLKTTSVYAENLKVNAAHIQEKLTAGQINTEGLIAENISSTTIDGKTITGGSILIGDTTKVGNYAEIANNGTLTCTNVNIKGGTLAIGSKNDEETHTWISTDGTLNTYNANIQGTLTSPTIIGGTINGSTLNGGTINGSTLNVGKILDEEGNHTGDYYTTITDDGYLKSVDGEFENCTITGGSLMMGSYNDGYSAWISSEDGVLHAYGACLEDIKTTSGTIGGWQITTDALYKNISNISSGMCSMQIKEVFSEGLEYILNSDETSYAVRGIGSCVDTNVVIPSTYNEMPVTSIRLTAFSECRHLTSITIPDSVTKIEGSAFYNCTSLTSITIPDSVTSIGDDAFSGCTSLTNIKIPNNITSISMFAFFGCTSLTNITIPEGVTSIGANAFEGCISLTNIIIPDSVTSISGYAFKNCTNLTSVYYVGSENLWNEITIYSGNSYLENATRYYYSSSELINNCDSLVNKNNISPPRFFAGSVSNIPTFVNDAKFLVLEDGSLYASAAKISGNIEATSGNISNLKIANGGLEGCLTKNNVDISSFKLNSSGLIVSNNAASIQVGAICLRPDEDYSVFSAQGAVSIQAENENGAIAYIKFGGVNAATSDIFNQATITLHAEGTGDVWSPAMKFYIKSDVVLPIKRTITVYYNIMTYGWNYPTNATQITLTINAGDIQSDDYIVTASYDVFNRWIRFSTEFNQVSTSAKAGSFGTSDTAAEICMNANNDNNSASINGETFTWSDSMNDFLVNGNIRLDEGVTGNLGSNDHPWTAIFAESISSDTSTTSLAYTDSGTVDSSDQNIKQDIEVLPESYSKLFDSLEPVRYKYIENTSNRYHTGFIAQNVLKSVKNAGLTSEDFAAYCEWERDNGNKTCGLRYSEFIALCVDQIQKLKARVTELESKI